MNRSHGVAAMRSPAFMLSAAIMLCSFAYEVWVVLMIADELSYMQQPVIAI